MTSPDVQRAAWKGATSNHCRVICRLVLGLLTFRMLYQGLSGEAFGLWSLLWSVFGYGVLLDFGFGAAAQKRVAESLTQKDWRKLSRSLSTILCVYTVAAFVIAAAGFLLSAALLRSVGTQEADLHEFVAATRLFFVGMAVGFPLGIFAEVLRGLQQTHVANRLAIGGLVANAILIALGLWLGWGLFPLFFISLLCVLLPDALAGYLALRQLPQVEIHPRHFSRAQLVQTSRFSLFVWASTMNHLLRSKTDQLVIGLLLSLPAVALYQASGKVAEMMSAVTKQVGDALTPAAAYLHADGERSQLRDLFLQGLRVTVALSTPLYLMAAFHLDLLLWILTGESQANPSVWLTGQILLFWCYQQTLTHLVFRRLFVMCGKERPLMWQSLVETFFNIVLSVGLTYWWQSILGVAVGSLVPAIVFGWLILWPWAAREAGLKGRTLFKRSLQPALLAGIPMALVGAGIHYLTADAKPFTAGNVALHLIGIVVTAFAGALASWHLVLRHEERQKVIALFQRTRRSLSGAPQTKPLS